MAFPLVLLALGAVSGAAGAIQRKQYEKDLLARRAAKNAEIDALDVGLSSATGGNDFDAEQMETMRKQFSTAQAMLKSQDPMAQKIGQQMLMDVAQAVRAYQNTNETQARSDENTDYTRGREQANDQYNRAKDQRDFAYKVQQDNRNFAASQQAQRQALETQFGAQAWTRFEALNDNLRQSSAPFMAQKEAYGRIRAAVADDSSAGDIAVVFNFMKMLDPTSVVRESEFAVAENTAGVPDSVRRLYNGLLSGQRLTKEQRVQFAQQADLQYQSSQAQQILRNTQTLQQARAAGVPDQLASTLSVPLEMPEVAFTLKAPQESVDRALLESMGPITPVPGVEFTTDQKAAGGLLKSFPGLLDSNPNDSVGGVLANAARLIPSGIVRGMTEFDQQQAARYMAGKTLVQGPDGVYYEQDREGNLKPLPDRDLALLREYQKNPEPWLPFLNRTQGPLDIQPNTGNRGAIKR